MYHAMEIIQICKNRNSQQRKQFITGLAISHLGVYSLNTKYIIVHLSVIILKSLNKQQCHISYI